MTHGSFNKYQEIHNEINENSIGVDREPISEPDQHDLARRDRFVYLLYSTHFQSYDEFRSSLMSMAGYNESEIILDINALKNLATFKLHKHRVKQKLLYKSSYKKLLIEQGSLAIYEAMNNSAPFDVDLITNLSKKYEYKPEQVVKQLRNYKKLSTQIAIFKQNNKKFPLISALIKCAKLNVMY
jgi:hypothetical protein